MNNFNFVGNIGRPGEVRHTPKGTPVCEFSVAVDSGYGENKKTNWLNCVILGKRAEGGLVPYLVKGQKVAISGEFSIDEWEKDGIKRMTPKVFVNTLDLVGEKKSKPEQPPQQEMVHAPPADVPLDDDIPF